MNSDYILFEHNKPKIKSLFNKHKSSDGKVSLSEFQKLCKNLRIFPDLISQSELRTLVTKTAGTTSLSKATLNINQFEEIFTKVASTHFEDVNPMRERIRKFFIHISYPCKSVYNLNIISTDQTHTPRASTSKLSSGSLISSRQDTEGDSGLDLDLNIKEALETLKMKDDYDRHTSTSPKQREISPIPMLRPRMSSTNPTLRDHKKDQVKGKIPKIGRKKPKVSLSLSSTMPIPTNKSPSTYKIDDMSNRILNEKVELSEFLETERQVENEVLNVVVSLKDLSSRKNKDSKDSEDSESRQKTRKEKRSITICLTDGKCSTIDDLDAILKDVDIIKAETPSNVETINGNFNPFKITDSDPKDETKPDTIEPKIEKIILIDETKEEKKESNESNPRPKEETKETLMSTKEESKEPNEIKITIKEEIKKESRIPSKDSKLPQRREVKPLTKEEIKKEVKAVQNKETKPAQKDEGKKEIKVVVREEIKKDLNGDNQRRSLPKEPEKNGELKIENKEVAEELKDKKEIIITPEEVVPEINIQSETLKQPETETQIEVGTEVAKSSIEIIKSSPQLSADIIPIQKAKIRRVVKKPAASPAESVPMSTEISISQPSIFQIKEVFDKFKTQHQKAESIKSPSKISQSTIGKYQNYLFSSRNNMFSKSLVLGILFRAWKIEAHKNRVKPKKK
ncbi:unnamed protein product [Blepharisma stoltei]|uniref:EF-hand domain-containing protein n=1 Tax=Blepharisma stoltei TaxID=1481888 RepID=A0AAU9IYC6_9CILI|nr:unnamed protein product [Blepharisma stoltei]